MKKPYSIGDIARLAGVSKTAVSFTINGSAKKYKISKETQDKIEKVVKKYNYRPNYIARSLRTGKTASIGMVVPDLENPYFNAIASHLEYFARQDGYSLIIASSDEDPEIESRVLQEFKSMLVDGIILGSVSTSSILNLQLPVIHIDRKVNLEKGYYVVSDNEEASYRLTQHLISKGVSKIAFIGGDTTLPTTVDRQNGYTKALKDSGITFNKVLGTAFNPESGYTAAKKIFEKIPPDVDAVYTASYKILEGFLKFVKEYEIDLKQIQIATFDDHPLFDFLDERICSIKQNELEIARKAYELFKKVLNSEDNLESQIVKATLVER